MSLFNQIVAHPRSLWTTISLGLLLFGFPLVAYALDEEARVFFNYGFWRPVMQSTVVIHYILIIAPLITKNDSDMLKAFRPLVLIDDEAYDRLVQESSHINPLGEVLSMLLGALIGFGLSQTWLTEVRNFWLRVYIPFSQSLMFGLLAWTIYSSFSSTRVIKELHRQPLKIDILNIKPFEPMGRHSLVTALVFFGGVTLAMIFSLNIKNIFTWQTWLSILPFLIIPIIIFFLSMGNTHRVLAKEKKRELLAVTKKIHHSSSVLSSRIANDEGLGEVAVEYTALVAYEARIKAASTWPYNTAMLRTLSFTTVVPLLIRALSSWLFGL